MVEINANLWRLDLDWRWYSRALELGCMMSINPVAHSISERDLTHWGAEMARKGGVPKERVLNCVDLDVILKMLPTEAARLVAARFNADRAKKARGELIGVCSVPYGAFSPDVELASGRPMRKPRCFGR